MTYRSNFLFHGHEIWNLQQQFIKDKKLLIKMQSDDEKYEWLENNFNIDKYLVKIKRDP